LKENKLLMEKELLEALAIVREDNKRLKEKHA
jgi:hypothetical protein